uniref:Reverse transcriptase domain-containing protein n=1 Tax=Aegilops tauschii subsp. strangulata TaxID=200361 RepID=A0A452Y8H6_AEGTS
GLRQGDPMSPQLFVLAVDALGRLSKHAVASGILQQLHPRRSIPAISLYADDVVLFCHPTPSDIMAVKAILHLFGKASGLLVNYYKSSAMLLHCNQEVSTFVATELGYQIADLPLTYLGILLSVRRLTCTQLQ